MTVRDAIAADYEAFNADVERLADELNSSNYIDEAGHEWPTGETK